jgi:hypothetical protein
MFVLVSSPVGARVDDRHQLQAVRWGEIFGNDVTAAVVDRLGHQPRSSISNGDSYRLKDKNLVPPPTAKSRELGCERRPVEGGYR